MIALDTNVLVRFLVRDNESQARIVYRRFKEAEAAREALFVPVAVLLETLWVLESAYSRSRTEILDSIEDLRRMPILTFEKDEALQRLLASARRNNADLADLLIAFTAEACGCDSGVTFDRKASRLPFFRLLR